MPDLVELAHWYVQVAKEAIVELLQLILAIKKGEELGDPGRSIAEYGLNMLQKITRTSESSGLDGGSQRLGLLQT